MAPNDWPGLSTDNLFPENPAYAAAYQHAQNQTPSISPEQLSAAQTSRDQSFDALSAPQTTPLSSTLAASIAAALPALFGGLTHGREGAGWGGEGAVEAMKNFQAQEEHRKTREHDSLETGYNKKSHDYDTLLTLAQREGEKKDASIEGLLMKGGDTIESKKSAERAADRARELEMTRFGHEKKLKGMELDAKPHIGAEIAQKLSEKLGVPISEKYSPADAANIAKTLAAGRGGLNPDQVAAKKDQLSQMGASPAVVKEVESAKDEKEANDIVDTHRRLWGEVARQKGLVSQPVSAAASTAVANGNVSAKTLAPLLAIATDLENENRSKGRLERLTFAKIEKAIPGSKMAERSQYLNIGSLKSIIADSGKAFRREEKAVWDEFLEGGGITYNDLSSRIRTVILMPQIDNVMSRLLNDYAATPGAHASVKALAQDYADNLPPDLRQYMIHKHPEFFGLVRLADGSFVEEPGVK